MAFIVVYISAILIFIAFDFLLIAYEALFSNLFKMLIPNRNDKNTDNWRIFICFGKLNPSVSGNYYYIDINSSFLFVWQGLYALFSRIIFIFLRF